MLKKLQNKQGFTLIELLIVVVILGILILIVIGATSGNKAKANDAKRNADLSRIQTALEDCFTDNSNSYPASLANTCVQSKFDNNTLPTDPKSNAAYTYSQTASSDYTLIAHKDDGTTVLTTLHNKQ